MKLVQFLCDSEMEAKDILEFCRQKNYKNPKIIKCQELQVLEVEGNRQSKYRFRIRAYQTDEFGGDTHLVTAEAP